MKSTPVPSPGAPTCTPSSRISVEGADQPAGRGGEAEQRQRRPPDRDAELAGGPPGAAAGEDRVAEAGAPQRPGWPAPSRPATTRSEIRKRPSPSCMVEPNTAEAESHPSAVLQPGDPGRAGHRLGAGLRGALQDEEGREGHEEARQPGVDHQEAVDQADGEGGRQRAGQRRPGAPSGVLDEQGGDQRAGHGEHADGQVELAGDEQQGHGHRADAQQGGDVEDAGQAAGGEQGRRLRRRRRRPRPRVRPGRAGSAGRGAVPAPGARARARPVPRPAWAADR